MLTCNRGGTSEHFSSGQLPIVSMVSFFKRAMRFIEATSQQARRECIWKLYSQMPLDDISIWQWIPLLLLNPSQGRER